MNNREIVFTVSVDDVQSLLNCDAERAQQVWDEMTQGGKVEDALEEDMMATFNAIVFRAVSSSKQ